MVRIVPYHAAVDVDFVVMWIVPYYVVKFPGPVPYLAIAVG